MCQVVFIHTEMVAIDPGSSPHPHPCSRKFSLAGLGAVPEILLGWRSLRADRITQVGTKIQAICSQLCEDHESWGELIRAEGYHLKR